MGRLGAGLISPARQIAAKQDQFGAQVQAFGRAFTRVLEIKDADLQRVSRVLDSVSYQRVLDRGFALVTGKDDSPVLSAVGAAPGDAWQVHFRDGAVAATVSGDAPPRSMNKPKKKAKRAKDTPNDPQGTLL